MPNIQNPTLHTVSKIISGIFNPLVSLLAFFIYYCARHFSLRETAAYFWPIFLIVALPVVLWILWNVRRGSYSNADVSNRRQRMSLYFFIEAVMAAYLVRDYLISKVPDYIFLFIFILLVALHISNYFIKSSMHTAFNVFVAALFFSEDPRAGLFWALLTALVGISRVVLRRHTVAEVLSGAAIAAAVSAVFLFVNINLNHC